MSRDLVQENLARHEGYRNLLGGSFAVIPVVAFGAIVVNIYFRVHGDANLATAIVMALPLSNILMVVLLNLMNLVILATGNATATIYGQRGLTPRGRWFAGTVLLAVFLIAIGTLPWYFFLGLGLTAYLSWRTERAVPAAPKSVQSWLVDAGIPLDTDLRRLWIEGRWHLKQKGVALQENPLFPTALPRPFRARKTKEIWDDIVQRQRQVLKSQRSGAGPRILAIVIASLSIYTLQVLSMPINFAPRELVHFDKGEVQSGYVLESGDGILFLNSTLTRARNVPSSTIVSREICTPAGISRPMLRVLLPSKNAPKSCSLPKDW